MISKVRKPNVYVTPDLVEGETCAVHIIKPGQTFITLQFDEGGFEVPYKPILTADNISEVKPKIRKQINKLEDRIVNLGEVYTCYNYLLTIRDGEIFLLSLQLGKITLGFEVTKEIAEKINIPTYNKIYHGPFCHTVVSSFIEDIFIQKQ